MDPAMPVKKLYQQECSMSWSCVWSSSAWWPVELNYRCLFQQKVLSHSPLHHFLRAVNFLATGPSVLQEQVALRSTDRLCLSNGAGLQLILTCVCELTAIHYNRSRVLCCALACHPASRNKLKAYCPQPCLYTIVFHT